jgi:hypothetical protein
VPHPAPLWLVSGDALDARNERTINLDKPVSKIFGAVHSETVDMLFTAIGVMGKKRLPRNAMKRTVACTEFFRRGRRQPQSIPQRPAEF